MTINLAQVFRGIAYKRLTPTEVNPDVSHGHEFQGVSTFRQLLGTEKRSFAAQFLYLADGEEVRAQLGELTWYDSRQKQPNRSAEYRLYYSDELDLVQELAVPGDLIVVALLPDERAVAIVARQASTWERQLFWLLNLELEGDGKLFRIEDDKELRKRELDLASRMILDELGIESPMEGIVDPDLVFSKFPSGFPTTRDLSQFARGLVDDVAPLDDPDHALIRWVTTEEQIFRLLESREWEQDKEAKRPCDDLDMFLEVSKSYQNRRKSRAGLSLENQLEHLFSASKLKFKRGGRTEGKRKPDFLFPSEASYHDPGFPTDILTFLGAKTSCKDRWRQILDEAKRIWPKHLVTLEPALSEDQTAEMQDARVQLVVPNLIASSYSVRQRGWLLSIADFIDLVGTRQDAMQ